MRIKSELLLLLCLSVALARAQSPLVPDVQVRRVMDVQPHSVRVVFDPYTASLLYNTTDGNIYCLEPQGNGFRESLLHTAAEHGVEFLMSMRVHGPYLYLAGNIGNRNPYTVGIIKKGTRFPDGSVHWSTLVQTEPYETAGDYDHMIGGMALSPDGDSLYFSNGSRGDHGEVNSRSGMFPGLRNTPLTTKVFCVRTDSEGLILHYDSADLAEGPYLFVSGVRNFFDMDFAPNGHLFALENSGDRDHNEEMNWLRKGRHYGFPWVMGETVNPLQFPGYDYKTDKLLPQNSYGKLLGLFGSDSTFPPPPPGLHFTDPVINLGPDCDKFKDTTTGDIYDASDMGIGIKTFTAHRSPLGLIFDRYSALAAPYTGSGFMLGYSKGVDSANAFYPNNLGGPFLDSSEDLVHLQLEYDPVADNYRVYSTRIVGGFDGPVDAELAGNRIYVIENGSAAESPGLYEVTMPANLAKEKRPLVYPNPASDVLNLRYAPENPILVIEVFSATGQRITKTEYTTYPGADQEWDLNVSRWKPGIYYCRITDGNNRYTERFQLLDPSW